MRFCRFCWGDHWRGRRHSADMLAGVTPIVLRKQVYASAAFVGAVLYACSYPFISHWAAMFLGAAVVVIIRTLAARYLWNLPVAIPEDWPPKE